MNRILIDVENWLMDLGVYHAHDRMVYLRELSDDLREDNFNIRFDEEMELGYYLEVELHGNGIELAIEEHDLQHIFEDHGVIEYWVDTNVGRYRSTIL